MKSVGVRVRVRVKAKGESLKAKVNLKGIKVNKNNKFSPERA